MPPSRPHRPRWKAWLSSDPFLIGVLTGAYLCLVLIAWLVIANHIPASADFAGPRNATAFALGTLVLLIPVVRFLREPAQLFASGIVAWILLSLAYLALGFFYHRLHLRMEPFNLFMLGAALYGGVAVVAWVATMLVAARTHSIAAHRRRPY